MYVLELSESVDISIPDENVMVVLVLLDDGVREVVLDRIDQFNLVVMTGYGRSHSEDEIA